MIPTTEVMKEEHAVSREPYEKDICRVYRLDEQPHNIQKADILLCVICEWTSLRF